MKLTLSAAALAALAAGTAGAAVNSTSVSTNLSLNSTVVGTAGIFANSGISDIGTYMGQVGTNSAIRGKYAAQMVGAAGSGNVAQSEPPLLLPCRERRPNQRRWVIWLRKTAGLTQS